MNRLFLIIIAVLLSFSGLFGYLSYKFYGEKAEAVKQLDNLQKANEALDESIKKQETE